MGSKTLPQVDLGNHSAGAMGKQLQPAGKATAIDLPAGIDARGFQKFGSVCNVNGKAVAVPYDAEKALMVDPTTGHASAIDLPTGIDASRSAKFWSMSAVSGKAVAVPWNDDAGTVGKSAVVMSGKVEEVESVDPKILVVDPATGQASAIDLPSGIDAHREGKFASVCDVNGVAVAVPLCAEKVLAVDPASGQSSAMDLPAAIDARKTGKVGSVCSMLGKAVAVPANAEKILTLDPATGQASAFDLPAGIDASTVLKFGSVCNVNGKAVAVPFDADTILVVDPATGQASAIDLPKDIDASGVANFGPFAMSTARQWPFLPMLRRFWWWTLQLAMLRPSTCLQVLIRTGRGNICPSAV